MLARHDTNEKSNLRLTSFIDVIFILLLFFIVTSMIMKQSGGREGERAYLKVQNAFSQTDRVRTFMTIFIYQSNNHIKYRLIHKGSRNVPVDYINRLARESQEALPNQNVVIETTRGMLKNPASPLSREMDKLDSRTIERVLTYYRKIFPNNDLNFAIVAQPNIPFFQVVRLYSFIKAPVQEGGLGGSQVALLEFDGNLSQLLDHITW